MSLHLVYTEVDRAVHVMIEGMWIALLKFKSPMPWLAGLVSLICSVDKAVLVLGGLMVLDYFSGVVAACKTKTLDKSIAFAGMTGKIMIGIVIGSCYLFAVLLRDVTGTDLDFASYAAFAYCWSELVSILQNAKSIGKVPKPVEEMFNKINKATWDGKVERRMGRDVNWKGFEKRRHRD